MVSLRWRKLENTELKDSLQGLQWHLQIVIAFLFRELGEFHQTWVLSLIVISNLKQDRKSACNPLQCHTGAVVINVTLCEGRKQEVTPGVLLREAAVGISWVQLTPKASATAGITWDPNSFLTAHASAPMALPCTLLSPGLHTCSPGSSHTC